MISKKLAKWIAYHPKTVLIVCLILIIPSIIGYFLTGVNYDILSYLPENLESVQGEQILDETFHNSASSFIIVKDTEPKDIQKLEDQIRQVEGVSNVIGATDIADVTIPKEILPEVLTNVFYSQDGSSTLIMVQYKNSGSSQVTMDAIASIRKIMNKNMLLSGLSAITVDTKDLTNSQAPLYVVIAIALALIALSFTMTSWVLPFVLLAALGTAVIYNMGTNIIFGEISFITKSIAAILQLGVTVDYSVFLMDRFEEEKKHHDTKKDAMAAAIDSTFLSLMGSSLTTVFGFLALCFMSFTLGKDMGLVMAKGVALGVICTVVILPSLILTFDKWVEKYKHRTVIPRLTKLSYFVSKHSVPIVAVFILILIPFAIAQNKTSVYYTLFDSLPQDLTGIVGTNKLGEDFGMTTSHFILVHDDLTATQVSDLCDELKDVDGITQVVSLDSITGPGFDTELLPDSVMEILQSGGYKLILANSSYKTGTNAINSQLDEMIGLIKNVDPEGVITGEGAMTKDLIEVADVDFKNVNVWSIMAVLVIIAISFKSISIPVLLVASIEAAIAINMGIPYFTGTQLPFIASIVIGTIQLGATVDYSILMTTRYHEERAFGRTPKEAAQQSLEHCSQSILTSGLTFFAATVGVAAISKMELLRSICLLISRGALISMLVILVVLPAALMLCDWLIRHTTLKWMVPESANAKKSEKE